MLTIKNLTKRFGSFTAVNNISLSIEAGELFGFLGPNGAGKTTTIKMVVGLYKPDQGTIHINGKDNEKEVLEAKKCIGYIPDQPFLYDKLTGLEFLFFSGGLFSIPKNILAQRVEEVVDLLKIGDWLNKKTEEYSQGMKQRITIASAFLHNPKLIVIDEPMVGLDPQSAHIVKQSLIKKAGEGTAVFMSTHSLNVVEEICTRVGIINKGSFIFDDSIDKLEELKQQKQHNIEQLFIELTSYE